MAKNASVEVWYKDGTHDVFSTEGGETDALAEELEADPDVSKVDRHYESDPE